MRRILALTLFLAYTMAPLAQGGFVDADYFVQQCERKKVEGIQITESRLNSKLASPDSAEYALNEKRKSWWNEKQAAVMAIDCAKEVAAQNPKVDESIKDYCGNMVFNYYDEFLVRKNFQCLKKISNLTFKLDPNKYCPKANDRDPVPDFKCLNTLAGQKWDETLLKACKYDTGLDSDCAEEMRGKSSKGVTDIYACVQEKYLKRTQCLMSKVHDAEERSQLGTCQQNLEQALSMIPANARNQQTAKMQKFLEEVSERLDSGSGSTDAN